MEAPSMSVIALNVAVQIVNLVIFYLVLKWLVGKPIVEELQKRQELIKKLQQADQKYEEIISQAKAEAQKIIDEAKALKQEILVEARQKAEEEARQILEEAQQKASQILEQAQIEAQRLKENLEHNWLEGVQRLTKVVVKKLIDHQPQLQEAYLKKLVEEFKTSL